MVQTPNLSQPWFFPFPQPLNLVYQKLLLFLPTYIFWMALFFTIFTVSSLIQSVPSFPSITALVFWLSPFFFCPLYLSLQSSQCNQMRFICRCIASQMLRPRSVATEKVFICCWTQVPVLDAQWNQTNWNIGIWGRERLIAGAMQGVWEVHAQNT